MDTTCLVGIQHTDEQVEYISVAWNGLGVGQVLYDHYQTREKVVNLIQQGMRAYLEDPDEIIEEDMEPSAIVSSYASFFRIKNASYYYIFTTDNTWMVYSIRNIPPIQSLKYVCYQ